MGQSEARPINRSCEEDGFHEALNQPAGLGIDQMLTLLRLAVAVAGKPGMARTVNSVKN